MALKHRIEKLENGNPMDGFEEFIRDLIMQAQGTALLISSLVEENGKLDTSDDPDSPSFIKLLTVSREAFYSGQGSYLSL